MQICVTGSIATDHLMTFAGKFTDSIVEGQLENLSVSFLVDDLQIRRGGVAANITFGLGCLGLKSILVGAVGDDFADYRAWLERHGVDTESVVVSDIHHTARFVCTTDSAANQIASFYPGAMSEAGTIELDPVAQRAGRLDLVVIAPNDPAAMSRHTNECRDRGIPFASDPSQQLAFMNGEQIRDLIDGAAYLFTNEYEAALTEQKTGWSAEEILSRVGVRVTTLGAKGARVEVVGQVPVHVDVAKAEQIADPTGVGDAFRAGFLAGLACELGHERSAQLGSMLATCTIETTGTQEYVIDPEHFMSRFADAYGSEAAEEIRAVVPFVAA